MKKVMLSMCTALALSAPAAFADEGDGHRIYFGGGYNDLEGVVNFGGGGNPQRNDFDITGYHARLGYRLHQNLAIEAYYANLDDRTNFQVVDGMGMPTTVTVEPVNFYGAYFRGIGEPYSWLDIYALAGFSFNAEIEIDEEDQQRPKDSFSFGFGLGFKPFGGLRLHVEWMQFFNQDDYQFMEDFEEVDLRIQGFNFGLTYEFNVGGGGDDDDDF